LHVASRWTSCNTGTFIDYEEKFLKDYTHVFKHALNFMGIWWEWKFLVALIKIAFVNYSFYHTATDRQPVSKEHTAINQTINEKRIKPQDCVTSKGHPQGV